jgi:hypothetical protein
MAASLETVAAKSEEQTQALMGDRVGDECHCG